MANEKFKVKFGLAVGDTAATVDGTTGDIITNGDIAVNGGDITTSNLTANVVNANATTVNIAGAATAVSIGAASGTTTVNNDLRVNGNDISGNSGTPITLAGNNLVVNGDLEVRGGDITTNQTAFNLLNTTATTVNAFGAATSVNIGNAAGTVTIPGNLTVQGTTTTIETTNLNVEDNIVTLNYGFTGTPPTSLRSGIEIERGSDPNVIWQWNELNKWWEPAGGVGGTTDHNIWATGDIISGNSLATNGTALTFNNDDGAGADVTITAKKGGGNYAAIRLNITSNRWETTVDNGVTWIEIPNQDLDTTASPTFADLSLTGDITIGGQDIKSNGGTTAITLSGADVTVAGDLTVTGNDIKSSTATALTLSGADVTVAGDLTITGNDIKASDGSIAITLAPITGQAPNVTTTGNQVKGVVRNATTLAAGDIWTLGPGGSGFRGESLDNSLDTTKGVANVLRSFSGGAVSGTATRGRLVFEKARGTAASPTANQTGDLLGSIDVTGYTSTGWQADNYPVVAGFFGFNASENWVSNTNVGTGFTLSLAPTATTVAAATDLAQVLNLTPQANTFRADIQGFSAGKTQAFTATGSSISGTTLTIGTVTSGTVAVGQMLTSTTMLANTFIIRNISGTGNGSTWEVSRSQTIASTTIIGRTGQLYLTSTGDTVTLGDLRVLGNDIQSQSGTTQIALSYNGTTLGLKGDAINLQNAAGSALTSAAVNYTRTYGEFAYTGADITIAAQNTIYAFPLDTTNFSSGVTTSNTSRINITVSGTYKLIMSLQAAMATNSVGQFDFWLRKNGVDVANSKTQVDLLKDQKSVIAMDWMVQSNGTDYFEIVYASASTNYANISFPTIAASASPYVSPLAPALILNVIPIGM